MEDLAAQLRPVLAGESGSLEIGLQQLSDAFESVDTDGDGIITERELKKAFRGLGIKLSTDDLMTLFEYFDPDVSGEISYGSLLHLLHGVE